MNQSVSNPSVSDNQNSGFIDRPRAALYIAIVLFIAGSVNAILSFSLGSQTGLWQHYVRGGITIVFIIAVAISGIVIRRGSYKQGTWIILIAFMTSLTSTAALFSNFGTALALIEIVITVSIAVTILQSQQIQRAIILGLITSIITYSFDFFELTYRIPVTPVFSTALISIAALVGLAFFLFIWKYFKLFPINTKLIISLISSAILAIVLLSSFYLQRSFASLREQISNNQSTQIKSGLAIIEEALSNVHKDILFLSQSTTLQGLALSSDQAGIARTKLEEDLLLFATLHPDYAQIRFLDAQGQEIVRVDNDQFGFSSAIPLNDLQNKSDRYYFAESIGLPKGAIYMSPLDLNVEQGQIEIPHTPMLRLATPVIFDGITYGEIILNLRAENFLALLRSQENKTFLVDLDGYYLYNQDDAKRWGRDLKTEIKVSQDFPELKDALLANNTQVFEANGQLFAVSPVTVFEELEPRWYLANHISTDEVFAPITQTRDIGVGIALLTLIVIAIATRFISRIITTPILQLTEVARALASGNLNVEAESITNDEIGILAKSFNAMTSQLRKMIADLEHRAEALRLRSAHLQAAAEVGRAAATIRDLDELLLEVAHLISEKFGYYHIGIFLLDEAEEYAVLRAANSAGGADMLAREHKLEIGKKGIVGYVVDSRTPRIALDVGEDATHFVNPDLPDTHSEMALPLIVGDQILGALDIQSTEADAFNSEDIATLEVLADQIAIAIENARLFSESSEALAAIRRAYGELSQQAWQDILQEKGELGFQYRPGKDREPQSITETSTVTVTSQTVEENNSLLVPVKVRGKVIAMLNFNKEEKQGIWTRDEIETLETVADQLSVALESARLFEESQRRAAREHVVGVASSRMRETLDIESVLQAAAQELHKALGQIETEVWLDAE